MRNQANLRPALLALAVGGFGIGTGEFVTFGLLPNIAQSLNIDIPRAGNLISAYALGVLIGVPFMAVLAARTPGRRFLVAMALAMAAGNFASAVMPNFGTLFAARFLTGVPHGAYFGVASVVATGMAPAEKRGSVMAFVFGGLTVANIVGVPLATLIGQHAGWRSAFVMVGVIELIAAALIVGFVPVGVGSPVQERGLRNELSAFRNTEVWLCLAIAVVGGSAFFCIFSYITPMVTRLAGYPHWAVTPLLVLFGVGMTAGVTVGARLADRDLYKTLIAALAAEAVLCVGFFFGVRNPVTAAVGIVLLSFCALAALPPLQTRIVSLAGGAPNLASSSIQGAFNLANTLGAWFGGLVIAASLGYAAPALVAAVVAACGCAIAVYSSVHAGRRLRVS